MESVLIVGAGQRGHDVYARLLTDHFPDIAIAGVIEPDATRREAFQQTCGATPAFQSVADLPPAPIGDLAIVATPDASHADVAVGLIERGYDVLIEKPMATRPADIQRLGETAARTGRRVFVAHVLRYAPFSQAVLGLVRSGRLGRIRHIDLSENVGHWHFAHSFVRGNWHRAADSAPIILAKSCHDLDLILWWLDEPIRRVSSIGRLTYFHAGNAPAGADARCTRCRYRDECLYSATRFYLHDDGGWPYDVLGRDRSARQHAIETTSYGRCVYTSDNDVPDVQLVHMQSESGVYANFSLLGVTAENTRKLRILFDDGELIGDLAANVLEIVPLTGRPGAAPRERVPLPDRQDDHGGGDLAMLRMLREHRATGAHRDTITSLNASLASHVLAFAAERSRAAGGVPVALETPPRG